MIQLASTLPQQLPSKKQIVVSQEQPAKLIPQLKRQGNCVDSWLGKKQFNGEGLGLLSDATPWPTIGAPSI